MCKALWQEQAGRKTNLRPDIVMQTEQGAYILFDTKWKNINGFSSSIKDLRQLYVYSKFHGNARSALVFPGEENLYSGGHFFDDKTGSELEVECGIHLLKVERNISKWQEDIMKNLLERNLKF